MMSIDRDALECDLAEIYGIYDYRRLPILKVAVFSIGLRDTARIKQKMAGQKTSDTNVLLAVLADRVGMLVSGGDYNEFILDGYIEREKDDGFITFESADAFDRAWEGGL